MITIIVVAVLILGAAGFVAYKMKRKNDKEEAKEKKAKKDNKVVGELCKPPVRK